MNIIYKIILDPGHGGTDSGGGCSSFFKEKDKVLKISLYQAALLMDANIPVVLTRYEDITLPSDKRTKIVRESGAKLCISNHVNAGGGTGFEIFHSIYAQPTFAQCIADRLSTSNMPARKPPVRTRESTNGGDYYFMHKKTGSVQTAIVEYGFGDNLNDAKKVNEYWQEYAQLVVEGIIDYYKKMGWYK